MSTDTTAVPPAKPAKPDYDSIAEIAIRLAALALLLYWCFSILRPFVLPTLWGVIIAVAIFPYYQKLSGLLGNRRKLAAALVSGVLFLVLLVPTALLTEALIQNVAEVAHQVRDGQLRIPLPPESVADWPVIGDFAHRLWTLAATNISEALKLVQPQVKALGGWLVNVAAGAGLGLLMLVFAFIIAGIMLANAPRGGNLVRGVSRRLAGQRGDEFALLAESTIRSVVRGVLGVAVIQALLAGIALLAAGVPGAGIWALLCLIAATVQVGVAPILIPASIWLFATGDTLTAVLFTAWAVFVMVLDNVLKPLLLGRGVDVPMVVIFLGAIGGMLMSGIVGLFIGALVLGLGYKLGQAWLEIDSLPPEELPRPPASGA